MHIDSFSVLSQGRIQDLIRGGAQIVTGLKLPFWGLSFVEFWCWGLIFGGQGGARAPGPPWIRPCIKPKTIHQISVLQLQFIVKLGIIFYYYVGTVNGPTSITRLGSFENVAKNCQFQFLDPPPQNCQLQFLDPPPKYCCQFQNCHFQFLDPSKILLPVSEFPLSVFRSPPNCQFQFLDPPKILLPVSVFRPPPKLPNIVASFSF